MHVYKIFLLLVCSFLGSLYLQAANNENIYSIDADIKLDETRSEIKTNGTCHDKAAFSMDFRAPDTIQPTNPQLMTRSAVISIGSHVIPNTSAKMKLQLFAVGFVIAYFLQLLTNNNIFENIYSNTQITNDHNTKIMLVLYGFCSLTSIFCLIFGTGSSKDHYSNCIVGFFGSIITNNMLSLISCISLPDDIYYKITLIMAAMAGISIAFLQVFVMTMIPNLSISCVQIFISGTQIPVLINTLFWFGCSVIQNTGDQTAVNNTNCENSTSGLNQCSSASLYQTQGFRSSYFFSSSIIISIVLFFWISKFRNTPLFESYKWRSIHSKNNMSSNLPKIAEILTSWKLIKCPLGLMATSAAAYIVYPFFMGNIVSSATGNEFIRNDLFIPFSLLLSSVSIFVGTIISNLNVFKGIPTNIFLFSSLLLFIFVPIFSLLNLKSTSKDGLDPYSNAPRLLHSNTLYFVMIVMHQLLFSVCCPILFTRSFTQIEDIKSKEIMGMICTTFYYFGLFIGLMLSQALRSILCGCSVF